MIHKHLILFHSSYLPISINLGLLHQDKIDVAPVDFSVTSQRSQAIDFLPSLSESYLQLFLKNPVDTLNWRAYIEPFTTYSWLVIIGFLFIAPIIISVILVCSKYYKRMFRLV